MELLNKIYSHSAYKSAKQEEIRRKKIEVLKLINDFKSIIAENPFFSSSDNFEHLCEMGKECKICQTESKHAQIIILLDDIQNYENGKGGIRNYLNKINFIKNN